MMQPDSKRPVTLEDIIRLKRAERPPAEFWNQFDRELRAKQLSALVEKRPWWKTLSLAPVMTALRRYHLPLGATAVLVVTFFSVREYRAPKAAPTSAPVVAAMVPAEVSTKPVAPSAIVTAPEARAAETLVVATAMRHEAAAARIEPALLEIPAPADRFVLSSAATAADDITPLIALAGVPGAEEATRVSPSARLIAENFAALQTDEAPVANSLLTAANAFETRAAARNKPVEPLAQMKVSGNSRRSAMIASATLVSTTAPVVTGDRAARSLSDERLYESISRVNARGAGMLVKF